MKNCGVLLHISSLPSRYGIGNLGREAYAFADFLHGAGQKVWQILPIGPTSYGDSPYQSPSSFAGNPYFIDLDDLCAQGLLTREECDTAVLPCGAVDYGALFASRMPLLRKAFARFDTSCAEYIRFCESQKDWLPTYALFTALKWHFSLRPHWAWPSGYERPDAPAVRAFADAHKEDLAFTCFTQYIFDTQWRKFKTYVNGLGIALIGDMPIYAAYDSADFWEDRSRFAVDENGNLAGVAGVPPDYFSADGQLWGNPLYDWDNMRADGYRFWIARIGRALTLFDRLRIDHFRGFCAYYAIPAQASTAREGVWKNGPGQELFKAVHAALGNADIIAEDLGVDAPELRKLLADCGYPGMKVMQFGFGGNAAQNAHALKNFAPAYVGYTGTHDNDTSLGWFSALSAQERKRVRDRLPRGQSDTVKAMICALYGSRVQTAVVPMQDWLRQGSAARMNTPGTSEGNWRYRMENIPSPSLQAEMKQTALQYGR